MSQYIMRLDDASEYMDVDKWQKMEDVLDQYSIKPIVGVIPDNQDPDIVGVYPKSDVFWDKVRSWRDKGWTIALHGYTHVFETNDGGINPVNYRSEYAGVSLDRQKEKVRLGVSIFQEHGLEPKVFFAPAHTFDENTLLALKEESSIQIISDTIANDVYFKDGFYFIPQQSGRVRKLPFKTVTFCYHPNLMVENDLKYLETFLSNYHSMFCGYNDIHLRERGKTLIDDILCSIYFSRRK